MTAQATRLGLSRNWLRRQPFGGIGRGTDVIKAMALGAHFVFVGRPAMFGLSVDGQQGVETAIGLLPREININLALLGCRSIALLDRSYLKRAGEPLSKAG